MKFATVMVAERATRLVLLREQDALDLERAGFCGLLELISAGDQSLARGKAFAAAEDRAPGTPLAECRFAAPLLRPPRVFGIGLNYQEHAKETKTDCRRHRVSLHR